jgi:membrane associated rhomboid family serine protease
MRAPRTQFGAKVASDGRPLVTMTIIGLCAAIWVLQRVSPTLSAALEFWPPAARSEPWRFLTSAFEHAPGQVLHILFNMYALWILGSYLEPMLGRLRFAALYLICAIGGSVGYLWLTSPQLDQASGSYFWAPVVGASGAVFGLFGALLVLNRHLGRSSGPIIGVIVINAVIGFAVPGIAWQAHLGGLVTGIVLALVITATAPQNRRKLQVPAMVAVLVLLAVAAAGKYAVLGI